MTLEQLEQIFKFQTTADEDYTPNGRLEYLLITDSYNKVVKEHAVADIATILTDVEHLVHEGYRDRMPIFIKPEVHVML
jgi:hypothetical protein